MRQRMRTVRVRFALIFLAIGDGDRIICEERDSSLGGVVAGVHHRGSMRIGWEMGRWYLGSRPYFDWANSPGPYWASGQKTT